MNDTTQGLQTMDMKNYTEDAAVIKHNTSSRTVKATSHSRGVHADWILYTVPSIAFVLGLVLFTLVCKTQSRRKPARRLLTLKSDTNGSTVRHSEAGQECTGSFVDKQLNLVKQEAQSYENVAAAIYNNQDKVTHDEDYITPDAMGDAGAMAGQNQNNHLQTPQTLTDTDGESYENMEGCVYAHPRGNTLRHISSTADDDYIDPDEELKLNMEQTDTESYENMFGSVYPCKAKPAAHSSTHTIDDDMYVCMDRMQNLDGALIENTWRGESERRPGREKQWCFRQMTV